MSKKLVKHGNSLALIIDKPLLDILKINESTLLELSINDGKLIINAINKKKEDSIARDSKGREEEISLIIDRLMKKYEIPLKKLAKT